MIDNRFERCAKCRNEFYRNGTQFRNCPHPKVKERYGVRICVHCCQKCSHCYKESTAYCCDLCPPSEKKAKKKRSSYERDFI